MFIEDHKYEMNQSSSKNEKTTHFFTKTAATWKSWLVWHFKKQ